MEYKSVTIVGYIENYGIAECWNWAMSIKASKFTGDVVVICCNVAPETIVWLESLGFTTYQHAKMGNIMAVVVRFLMLGGLLKQGKIKTEYVMLSDVKDVVFQTDLNEYVWSLGGDFLGGTENVRYKDEPWGNHNMKSSFPFVYDEMKDKEIINAGSFCARQWLMEDICKFVFHLSIGSSVPNPDQAAFNIVMKSSLGRGAYTHLGTIQESPYAIQIGTTFDPTKDLKQIIPLDGIGWDSEGYVSNKWGRYCIVHQYDRNPELKALVDERYKEK